MYTPKHFNEPDTATQHALMRAQPLATLVTLASSGLDANHLPLHLSAELGPLGTLRGHVARANPLWKDLTPELEVLAVFHGVQAYVSPNWYPTKAEHGKAVPTWNYAVVHAHGTLKVVEDATWLRAHLEALTAHNEASQAQPWKPSDAPADYLEKMMSAIIGIEITITRLSGKFKLSQNQPEPNQAGVIQGLRATGLASDIAMAEWVARATADPT
jgi:transcriptional regulator